MERGTEENWATGPISSTAIIGSLEKWAAFSKITQLEQVLFN